MSMTPFCQYVLGMVILRSAAAQDHSMFFTAPNEIRQIAYGNKEPTDEDFIKLAAYLDISEDYLKALYSGEQEFPKSVTPHVGGG